MGEIFAAALGENVAARIVGARTAGSVAGGQLFCAGRWVRAQRDAFEVRSAEGAVLNGVGVFPDEAVDGDWVCYSPGSNPAIERAKALLRATMAVAPASGAGGSGNCSMPARRRPEGWQRAAYSTDWARPIVASGA